MITLCFVVYCLYCNAPEANMNERFFLLIKKSNKKKHKNLWRVIKVNISANKKIVCSLTKKTSGAQHKNSFHTWI